MLSYNIQGMTRAEIYQQVKIKLNNNLPFKWPKGKLSEWQALLTGAIKKEKRMDAFNSLDNYKKNIDDIEKQIKEDQKKVAELKKDNNKNNIKKFLEERKKIYPRNVNGEPEKYGLVQRIFNSKNNRRHKLVNKFVTENKQKQYVMVDVNADIYYAYGHHDNEYFTFIFDINDIKGYRREIDNLLVRDTVTEYLKRLYLVTRIENLNIISTKMVNRSLSTIKYKSKSLAYKFLDDVNGHIEEYKNDNECLLRYIHETLSGNPGFVKFNMSILKQQLHSMKINYKDGLTVDELVAWVKRFYPNLISVYPIDPLFKVFNCYVPKNAHNVYQLVFICNNEHIYPITNERIKTFVSNAKRLNIETLDLSFKSKCTEYELIQRTHFKATPETTGEACEGVINVHQMTDQYKDLIEGKLKDKIFLVDNVYACAVDTMKVLDKKYTISNMKTQGGKIKSFVHPVSLAIIEDGTDYEDRKKICDYLYSLYPCEQFKFKNQSLGSMAEAYHDIKYGRISRFSFHRVEDIDFYNKFEFGPLVTTLKKNHRYNKTLDMDIDIKRCYPNCVINNKYDYPVFSTLDAWKNYEGENITCGEYLIDNIIIKKYSNLPLQKQIMPYNLVKYMLDNNLIKKENILCVRKASRCFPAEIESKFMTDLINIINRETYGDNAKLMSNSYIGKLGKKYNKSDKSFITTNFDVVCGMFYQKFNENDFQFNCNKINDFFFARFTNTTRLMKDNTPIHRQILGSAYIEVFELLNKVHGPKSELIGINTDCIFIRNPEKVELDETKYRWNQHWTPKMYHPFELNNEAHALPEQKDWNLLDDICFVGNEIYINGKEDTEKGIKYAMELKDKSFLCTGGAGSQKSTLIINTYDKNTLGLAYKNVNVQDLRNGVIKAGKCPKDKIPNFHTFDSYFYNRDENLKLIKFNKLVIDEFGNLPSECLERIYRMKITNPDLVIQFYGDTNQTKQIDDRYYDYMNKSVIKDICGGNIMRKKYVDGGSRYDVELNEILNYFIENQRLPESLKNKCLKMNTLTNITKSNKLRRAVNKKYLSDLKKRGTVFDSVVGEWYMYQEIISNVNKKGVYRSQTYFIRQMKVYNNELFVALSQDRHGEYVKDKLGKVVYYPINRIQQGERMFDPIFATTVYRSQGRTIEDEYNIFFDDTFYLNEQLEMFTFNEAYTALSRGRTINKIHFNYTDKFFERERELEDATVIGTIKPKIGYVYELYNQVVDMYYVGLTENTIQKRFTQHKENKDSPIHQHGELNDWGCKEIGKIYYFKLEELNRLETYYIKQYVEQGKKLCNKQKVPSIDIIKAQANVEACLGEDVKTLYHIEKQGVVSVLKLNERLKKRLDKKKQNIDNLFKIKENKDCFRINYTKDGIEKKVRVSFKKISKEEAFEIITEKREQLMRDIGFDKQDEQQSEPKKNIKKTLNIQAIKEKYTYEKEILTDAPTDDEEEESEAPEEPEAPKQRRPLPKR